MYYFFQEKKSRKLPGYITKLILKKGRNLTNKQTNKQTNIHISPDKMVPLNFCDV